MDENYSSYAYEKELLLLDGMNFFVESVKLKIEQGKDIYVIKLKTH